MAYLEEYGVADARRERRIKRALVAVFTLLVVSGFLYFWFKNYREEQRVKEFLSLLERGDYPAAYRLWGCRVESPCPNYDYNGFLEDWGPSSEIGKLRSYDLIRSREQGSGVAITLVINGRPPTELWVEKKDGIIGFAPPF